jgi:hypothetical protein
MSRKNNKKKGTLYKTKQNIAVTIVIGALADTDIEIPSQTVCLMLKSKAYIIVSKWSKRIQRLIRVRFLLDTKVIEVQNISKGRFNEYFERVKL